MAIVAEKNTSQGYADPKERSASLAMLTELEHSFIFQFHLLILQVSL